MNILTAMILDVINAFHNKNISMIERIYVSTPPYYLDCFEKYYSNIPLNQYEEPFCIQCMNRIQGIKLDRKKWN